jgi:hypothetical protein
MRYKYIVAFFTALILVSCTSVSTQIPTEMMVPTDTFLPPSPTLTLEPTLTMTPSPTQPPTVIPTLTFAPVPSERADYDNISGTYKFNRGDGGECDLKINFEPSIKPYFEISFELACIRGAPSYNSGWAMGKILMNDNVAVYARPSSVSDSICNIVFQFDNNQVKVTQLGMDYDCGFGHAVYADGLYTLVDAKPPSLGCLGVLELDNPCLTTPRP